MISSRWCAYQRSQTRQRPRTCGEHAGHADLALGGHRCDCFLLPMRNRGAGFALKHSAGQKRWEIRKSTSWLARTFSGYVLSASKEFGFSEMRAPTNILICGYLLLLLS